MEIFDTKYKADAVVGIGFVLHCAGLTIYQRYEMLGFASLGTNLLARRKFANSLPTSWYWPAQAPPTFSVFENAPWCGQFL